MKRVVFFLLFAAVLFFSLPSVTAETTPSTISTYRGVVTTKVVKGSHWIVAREQGPLAWIDNTYNMSGSFRFYGEVDEEICG